MNIVSCPNIVLHFLTINLLYSRHVSDIFVVVKNKDHVPIVSKQQPSQEHKLDNRHRKEFNFPYCTVQYLYMMIQKNNDKF